MKRRKEEKPGYARLLDTWTPPPEAGEPLGCVATSFTFSSVFFEEECLGRFVRLETDAAEDGAAFLVEREEKFSQLVCASALIDQRHARGLRSLRWDLLAARLPAGILHAKISLLLWTNTARIIVASANLTEDGYRRNHEVFGVLDYLPGGSAPLNVLRDLIAFLESAAGYVDPKAATPDAAIARWQAFLNRVRAATREWGAGETPRGGSPRVHAILTGPDRGSVFDGVKAAWRESAPPEKVWVVSPFFDPPEAPNAPAQEIWRHLRQRGDASVCYVVQGEEIEGTDKVRLLAPETLRWKPANRPVTIGFERLEIEPTRPLHAKCLWFEGAEWFVYVCGSSNFTSAGLGIGATRNLEANLAYVVNFQRDKEATRACNGAWLKHEPPPGEPMLIPAPDNGEDSATAGEPLLPVAFGSATFAREPDGKAWIDFTFHGTPPTCWQALPEDDEIVFLDETIWDGRGRPTTLRMPWASTRPPAGLRIIRPGVEGEAWWPVNVRDGASLPPPAELSDLPLEVLIEILTSAKPLHLALQRWLARQKGHGTDGPAVLLDPHERVDTSTFLLQRTRRVSWALDALRTRLERPVASSEALDWRLRGPVGVQAISRAIVKEARSAEERAFLLAELMLELARVRPSEIPGGLPLAKIKAGLREMIAELRALLAVESLPNDPTFRAYLEAASATAR
jgi:hypothetical protein